MWWEGKDGEVPPTSSPTGKGNPWKQGVDREGGAPELALHRARRRTTPCSAKFYDDPEGVPISAIVFGGRRATTVPLVMQAFNWTARRLLRRDARLRDDRGGHGQGRRRAPRPDGDAALLRLQHGRVLRALAGHAGATSSNPPKVFLVNWFRQGQGRQVPLAGLRREHARPQVDRRPRAPPRRRAGDALRLGAQGGGPRSLRPRHPAEHVDEATSIDERPGRRSSSRRGSSSTRLGPRCRRL